MTGAALDQAALASFRDALETQRGNVRREIAAEGADPDADGVPPDAERGFADSAHTTAERARQMALVEGLRGTLRDVDRALEKVDRGTYGLCERCGQPIARERLEAIPWARLCFDCKQKER